ncbi:alpha/beta hydrolase [Actinomycetospora termitidis]|uniref:Alpha/beta hydrolase n=1 Tax=Actinomycetospora termitidis TaxID=3053470 RepID=A0ABT7MED8_9PSEU|nr:alpha/beta hydrolase [Actinomycetospora sp. Odt1-22]MDL5159031.1 alpha/beta hydrolase [Actinomycetospora sp. Odt1-22]
MFVIAGTMGAVVLLLNAGLWLGQRRLIYLPEIGPVPAAATVLPGARDVVLETADGTALGAWFVPAEGPRREVTVLVANGNAGDRSLRAPLAAALRAEGLDVLLFDYRGYGDSTGSPSEEGLAADARAAHQHLVTKRAVLPQRTILLGESLGAGVTARLATEVPVGGMVLRSPFTDLAAVAERLYPVVPVRLLLADRFPVADLVARADVPTTVVLGEGDRIIPPALSRAVADAAGADVVAVPGADHNDAVLGHGPAVVGAVVRLADALDRPAG